MNTAKDRVTPQCKELAEGSFIHQCTIPTMISDEIMSLRLHCNFSDSQICKCGEVVDSSSEIACVKWMLRRFQDICRNSICNCIIDTLKSTMSCKNVKDNNKEQTWKWEQKKYNNELWDQQFLQCSGGQPWSTQLQIYRVFTVYRSIYPHSQTLIVTNVSTYH